MQPLTYRSDGGGGGGTSKGRGINGGGDPSLSIVVGITGKDTRPRRTPLFPSRSRLTIRRV